MVAASREMRLRRRGEPFTIRSVFCSTLGRLPAARVVALAINMSQLHAMISRGTFGSGPL